MSLRRVKQGSTILRRSRSDSHAVIGDYKRSNDWITTTESGFEDLDDASSRRNSGLDSDLRNIGNKYDKMILRMFNQRSNVRNDFQLLKKEEKSLRSELKLLVVKQDSSMAFKKGYKTECHTVKRIVKAEVVTKEMGELEMALANLVAKYCYLLEQTKTLKDINSLWHIRSVMRCDLLKRGLIAKEVESGGAFRSDLTSPIVEKDVEDIRTENNLFVQKVRWLNKLSGEFRADLNELMSAKVDLLSGKNSLEKQYGLSDVHDEAAHKDWLADKENRADKQNHVEHIKEAESRIIDSLKKRIAALDRISDALKVAMLKVGFKDLENNILEGSDFNHGPYKDVDGNDLRSPRPKHRFMFSPNSTGGSIYENVSKYPHPPSFNANANASNYEDDRNRSYADLNNANEEFFDDIDDTAESCSLWRYSEETGVERSDSDVTLTEDMNIPCMGLSEGSCVGNNEADLGQFMTDDGDYGKPEVRGATSVGQKRKDQLCMTPTLSESKQRNMEDFTQCATRKDRFAVAKNYFISYCYSEGQHEADGSTGDASSLVQVNTLPRTRRAEQESIDVERVNLKESHKSIELKRSRGSTAKKITDEDNGNRAKRLSKSSLDAITKQQQGVSGHEIKRAMSALPTITLIQNQMKCKDGMEENEGLLQPECFEGNVQKGELIIRNVNMERPNSVLAKVNMFEERKFDSGSYGRETGYKSLENVGGKREIYVNKCRVMKERSIDDKQTEPGGSSKETVTNSAAIATSNATIVIGGTIAGNTMTEVKNVATAVGKTTSAVENEAYIAGSSTITAAHNTKTVIHSTTTQSNATATVKTSSVTSDKVLSSGVSSENHIALGQSRKVISHEDTPVFYNPQGVWPSTPNIGRHVESVSSGPKSGVFDRTARQKNTKPKLEQAANFTPPKGSSRSSYASTTLPKSLKSQSFRKSNASSSPLDLRVRPRSSTLNNSRTEKDFISNTLPRNMKSRVSEHKLASTERPSSRRGSRGGVMKDGTALSTERPSSRIGSNGRLARDEKSTLTERPSSRRGSNGGVMNDGKALSTERPSSRVGSNGGLVRDGKSTSTERPSSRRGSNGGVARDGKTALTERPSSRLQRQLNTSLQSTSLADRSKKSPECRKSNINSISRDNNVYHTLPRGMKIKTKSNEQRNTGKDDSESCSRPVSRLRNPVTPRISKLPDKTNNNVVPRGWNSSQRSKTMDQTACEIEDNDLRAFGRRQSEDDSGIDSTMEKSIDVSSSSCQAKESEKERRNSWVILSSKAFMSFDESSVSIEDTTMPLVEDLCPVSHISAGDSEAEVMSAKADSAEVESKHLSVATVEQSNMHEKLQTIPRLSTLERRNASLNQIVAQVESNDPGSEKKRKKFHMKKKSHSVTKVKDSDGRAAEDKKHVSKVASWVHNAFRFSSKSSSKSSSKAHALEVSPSRERSESWVLDPADFSRSVSSLSSRSRSGTLEKRKSMIPVPTPV